MIPSNYYWDKGRKGTCKCGAHGTIQHCAAMYANGESELIPRLEDEAFLEEMLKKYQLLEVEDD